MGKTISFRFTSPEDEEEFARHVEAAQGRGGEKGPSTVAKELLQQLFKEQQQSEELKHQLETLDVRIETLQQQVQGLGEEQHSFGRAILMAVSGIGTDRRLTPKQAATWLKMKGSEK